MINTTSTNTSQLNLTVNIESRNKSMWIQHLFDTIMHPIHLLEFVATIASHQVFGVVAKNLAKIN